MRLQMPELDTMVERLAELKEQSRTLEARVGRLAGQNRALRSAGIAVLVLVGMIGLVAAVASGPKVVEAEKFVLRDAHGKTRAALGIDEIGRMDLMLFDEEGKERAALGVFKGVPALRLFDEDGAQCVTLSVSGGSPLLDLRAGEDAKRQFTVGTSPNGGPNVALCEEGRVRATLGLGEDGSPVLQLVNKDGRGWVELCVMENWGIEEFPGLLARLGLGPDGPVLTLRDAKAKVVFKAP